jgi:hypothetical protein
MVRKVQLCGSPRALAHGFLTGFRAGETVETGRISGCSCPMKHLAPIQLVLRRLLASYTVRI